MKTHHHVWIAVGVVVVLFVAYEWYKNSQAAAAAAA